MSPPWGGPAYAAAAAGFDVAADLGGLGVSLGALLAAARAALRPGGRGVAVFMPRNTLLAQVPPPLGLAHDGSVHSYICSAELRLMFAGRCKEVQGGRGMAELPSRSTRAAHMQLFPRLEM